MSEQFETRHAVRMRKLLTYYSENGRPLRSLTKIMGRKPATLKKWASRYNIRFNDFKPKEKI